MTNINWRPISLALIILSYSFMACGSQQDITADQSPSPKSSNKGILLFSGRYDILANSNIIGSEDFSLTLLSSLDILVKSEAIRDKGFKYQHSAEFIMDNRGRLDNIAIRYHGGGLTRTQFVRNVDDTYSCALSTGDGRMQQFDFKGAQQLDIVYNLLAFSIPILSKLNLSAGEFKDIHAILIESGSLKAFDSRFRYRHLEDSLIEVPAGKFYARKYSVSDCQDEHKSYFWAEQNNIILCFGDNFEGNNHYQLSTLIKGSEVAVDASPRRDLK